MNIQQQFHQLREKKGISLRTLSEISGVNKDTIFRIERGTNSPSIETMDKLLKPLGAKLAIVIPL